ncbi:putative nuclease HARBI1 [Polyergus mexicanus]|uniref:putative nuclease HARBI1 n=1 Tax=Polyergus mexicanus TaxID=615972 RepID=UPI0038B6AC34
MDNEFLNDSDDGFEDENPENRILWRIPKRYIRDWENPVEFFEDIPFRKRYRFSKGAVIEILLPLKFYEVANFPSVIGCIDCTHIRIANPGGNNGEIFRNRKGWFSLNVQAVAGPKREILDIVVRHPGSTHDAVIFDRSGLRCRFELGHLDGILLGDSGYACRSYLLTPVLRPETDAEVRYNTAHKKTRVIVEQLFGVWKRRFPCLHYGLRTKLNTSVTIVCATAVLHNVCIQHNLGEVVEDHLNHELNENVFQDIVNREQNGIGLAHRNAFILRHFS